MNGAECLLRTLLAHDIDVCFMNPGTSEMQFVAVLDQIPEMRGILGLEENICSGAADGYARVSGRTASTLLHLGPGLANALSNLHNARKARSPIVNIVGEHATQHSPYDAPLTADTAAFAAPVSAWTHTTKTPEEVGPATARAVLAARTAPGGIASLIIPADHSWLPAGSTSAPLPVPALAEVGEDRIAETAALLGQGGTAFYVSGRALSPQGVQALGRIHAATGAPIFMNRFTARQPRGRGREFLTRMPYFPEVAEAAMRGIRRLILVETAEPVSFFAYPGRRSTLKPEDCEVFPFASETEDSAGALRRLAERFPARPLPAVPAPELGRPVGALTLEALGAILANELPEDAIISDEMVSSGEPVNRLLAHAAPHDTMPVCGGSIGQGLPLALGAAIGAPHRKSVSLQADGSGMYTLQALWTMARERCDTVIVIFANRKYRILEIEMRRTGVESVAPRAQAMLDIDRPDIDWRGLARAMGVPAERAESCEQFVDLFRQACREPGPFLIEAII